MQWRGESWEGEWGLTFLATVWEVLGMLGEGARHLG